MKESGSDIGYISELVARTPDDFTVLAGSATTFFHALCAGCDGAILALAALSARCVRADPCARPRDIGLAEARCAAALRSDAAGPLGRRHLRRGRSQGRARPDSATTAACPVRRSAPPPPHVVETISGQLAALGAFKEISRTNQLAAAR